MTVKPTYEELERRVQELEKAESERSLAEDRLIKIFDNTQDAIFIHDLEGKILDVNDKMCRLYGLTKEEALEVSIEDVSSSRMSMKVLLERWQKVLNGEKLLFEWEARRPKDESVFNVEVSIQMLSFHDKDIILANIRDITERKRAKEELLELKTAVEQYIDGIALVNMDGSIQFLNDTWAGMHGCSKDELIGRHLSVFHTHEQMEKEVIPFIKRLNASGSNEGEVMHVRKDGTIFPTHMTTTVVKNAAGNHFRLLTVARDITARKQLEFERESTVRMLEILNAETVLRKLTHSLLHFMQEITGCEAVAIRLCDGEDFPYYDISGFSDDFVASETHLCVGDLNGQLELDDIGNPVLECMCGNVIRGRFDSSKPFFTGFGSFVTNSTTRMLADTSEQDRQSRTRNRCNGEGYESVLLIPLRTGGKTFGLLQFNDRQEGRFPQQIVSHMEKIAGSVSLALAQRELEKALKKSEKRYRTILNEMAEGYHEADLAGNFTFFNDAFLNLFGYSSEEMTGTNFSHYAAEESIAKKVYQTYSEIYKTGESVQKSEWDIIRKDGQRRTLEYQAAVVKDSKNITSGFRGIVRDITERKQMETDLRRSRDGLGEQVQKRTAELEKLNEALRMEIEKRKKFEADLKLQNKKILKEQERRKYLSIKLVEILEKERRAIAESLHNDVGQILAKLNMDLDDVIDASEHAPIKANTLFQIQSSIMESMDYVSWLAGSLRPHILENLGLVPAIRNMLNKMKTNSNVSFHLHTQGDFLQIDDEKALAVYRIAQEAVTNCLKHARAENIIVNLIRNDQFLSITIEDDGPGFEYDKISAKEDEKDKLGLIIMHERAIQVGGEFRITSQIGKGTRVTVETPVE